MAKDDHSEKKIDYIQERVDTLADKLADLHTNLASHTVKVDGFLEKMSEGRTVLERNNEILQANTDSLKTHMYRTDLLEQYVKKVDARFSPIEVQHLRNEAIKEWSQAKLVIVAKVGAALGALGSIGLAVKYLLHLFL